MLACVLTFLGAEDVTIKVPVELDQAFVIRHEAVRSRMDRMAPEAGLDELDVLRPLTCATAHPSAGFPWVKRFQTQVLSVTQGATAFQNVSSGSVGGSLRITSLSLGAAVPRFACDMSSSSARLFKGCTVAAA